MDFPMKFPVEKNSGNCEKDGRLIDLLPQIGRYLKTLASSELLEVFGRFLNSWNTIIIPDYRDLSNRRRQNRDSIIFANVAV